jgi:protocatechuate 3,4-dioxygenase beta subunit
LQPEMAVQAEQTKVNSEPTDKDSNEQSTGDTNATNSTAKDWDALDLTPGGPNEEVNSLTLVCRDEAGEPVAGATATLYHIGTLENEQRKIATASTDAEGAVKFSDILPAEVLAEQKRRLAESDFPTMTESSYLVVLSKQGLATAIHGTLELTLAGRAEHHEVKMSPGNTLKGKVLDADGKPVVGALVAVGSHATLAPIEGVNAMRADEQGRYKFKDLKEFDSAEAVKHGLVLSFVALSNTSTTKVEPYRSDIDLEASLIVVRHPDYAVSRQIAGDIPGTFDVTLQRGGEIAGRVIHATDGRPVADIPVHIGGQSAQLRLGGDPIAQLTSFLGPYFAIGRTDREGRYRFANLPPDRYVVAPQPSSSNIMKADWIGRGLQSIAVRSGETTEVTDLKIGRGGLLRGQLIDSTTDKPPVLGDAGAKLTAIFSLVNDDGFKTHEHFSAQGIPCSPEGKFVVRTPPGKFRLTVFLVIPGTREPSDFEFRSDDYADSQGPILEASLGETLESEIEVHSAKLLEERHKQIQQGNQLREEGKFAEAVEHFTRLLQQYPDNFGIHLYRSQCYKQLGNYVASLADLEQCYKLHPERVAEGLAFFLATVPEESLRDGPRAIRLAREAIEFFRKSQFNGTHIARLYKTLAAAQAEAGDFVAAIETQKKAIEIEPDAVEYRKLLERYKKGKPYRLKDEE